MGNNTYPQLQINVKKIYENTREFVEYCHGKGVSVSGVIKGFNALPLIVNEIIRGGCAHIASSRIEQLIQQKKQGLDVCCMLLRLPMYSELENLVKYVDISLNSELGTLELIENLCVENNKRHGVILMLDLGDLREGFIDSNELVEAAVYVEEKLKHIELKGIGTNLGCYGSVKPTVKNLSKLVEIARVIEKRIGRKLEIISGGATSSIPLLLEGKLPEGINNLRVGEGILLNRDLPDIWKVPVLKLHQNTFILKAQVIEIKEKPSYPIGELFIDASGNLPVYINRGIRKRAILAVGRQDFGMHDKLIPLLEGIEVIGSSSDHLIIDIETYKEKINVGDILEFGMYYMPMLYLTASCSVEKVYEVE